MKHRIGLPRAVKQVRIETGEVMIGKLKPRVLPGDQQPRALPDCGERMGDWTKLDGFRASSDDERDT
jgi:hypothetical protein